MKASELSIGDWVQVHAVALQGEERLTPPMRVVEIGETWVNLEIDPKQGDPFEEDIEDICPIPLTTDILDRNGFDLMSDSPYKGEYRFDICRKTNHYLFITFYKKFYCVRIVFEPLDSVDGRISFMRKNCGVHELQHVMRMMGIDKDIII